MDKNVQSWHNSDNSSYNNFDCLVDGRNIRNLLSDKTFLARDSKRKSYSISFAIENNILEIDIDNDDDDFFLNEPVKFDYDDDDFFDFFPPVEIDYDDDDFIDDDDDFIDDDDDFIDDDDDFIDDDDFFNSFLNDDDDDFNFFLNEPESSDWNDNLNRCVENYLRSQICIDSYIFGKVSNSGESESTSTNPMEKYRHLWVGCESCYGVNYKKFFKSKMNICEHCGFHLKMSSSDRIELLIDPDTWNPMDEYMVSVDPIEFHSEEDPYKNRLDSYQKKTGLMEAVQTGTGQLNGIPLAIGIMEFQFMGGSMGSVVGEKITRLIEYATNERLPLILVCASGGARMQEGSLSLMQMAKISSALYDYQINQKLFYVPILTSPTTGGVTASFGMLGDIIIAEPNAYIAFAGKRVIEQTLNKEVPEGSQSAELLFEKGLIDSIVPRNLLKEVLTELFKFHGFVPLTQNEK
uniref:Acetyl-coenzyme A carboxylase carboxyl transferase subunit beta, chloroplastic n=1 Tax=Astragalus psilosepalus TaxID=3077617 RepID=A0AA96H978_9FABA|nr:acetyl-CoA carboxylase carboxyltransferase beta subunit [Astragalus psilosepalus]WNM88739.1 acetyl-CoA carboxylase carboxyltransferase beta subunit [Astragalus psilosepalus]